MENPYAEAGSLQALTCTSQGGSPVPTLRWFRNDKEVSLKLVKSFYPCEMCLAMCAGNLKMYKFMSKQSQRTECSQLLGEISILFRYECGIIEEAKMDILYNMCKCARRVV